MIVFQVSLNFDPVTEIRNTENTMSDLYFNEESEEISLFLGKYI